MFQIDEHVQREIMNHRSLKHPNIVRFKEVRILSYFLLYETDCFVGDSDGSYEF